MYRHYPSIEGCTPGLLLWTDLQGQLAFLSCSRREMGQLWTYFGKENGSSPKRMIDQMMTTQHFLIVKTLRWSQTNFLLVVTLLQSTLHR